MIMADLPSKVRFCSSSGCTTRMSSLEKDRHLLCPKCRGGVCSLERRCDLCKEWSEEEMKAYCMLLEVKQRNKAYKAKQRAAKITTGAAGDSTARGSAHSLSSSDDSMDDIGKKVPFSVDRNLDQPKIRVDKPSNLPPSSSSFSLSQGLAGLPGSSVFVGEDPHFSVDRELVPVSSTGLRGEPVCLADNHPQQGSSKDQVESGSGRFPQDIFRTLANLVHNVTPSSSVRSRGSFSASVNSALRAIVRENQAGSEEEVMRQLKEYLNKTDPSLSSYSSERRKYSVGKRSIRDRSGDGNSYYEPSNASFQELRKEKVEVEVHKPRSESVKRSSNDLSSVPAGKKAEISREMARMIETGGVKVRSNVRFFWVNKEGVSQFVVPSSVRPRQGKVSALGEKEVPPTRGMGPSPAKAVSPAIVAADPQFRETLGVSALSNANDVSVCQQSALSASCVEREASLALGEGKASHSPREGGVSLIVDLVLGLERRFRSQEFDLASSRQKSSFGSIPFGVGSEGQAGFVPDQERFCLNFPSKSRLEDVSVLEDGEVLARRFRFQEFGHTLARQTSPVDSIPVGAGSGGHADILPDQEVVCSNFPSNPGGGKDSGSRILDLVHSEVQEPIALKNKDSVSKVIDCGKGSTRDRVIEESVLKVVEPRKVSAPLDSLFVASTPHTSFGALSVGDKEVQGQSPFATASVQSDGSGFPCHRSRYVFKGSESLPIERVDKSELKIYAGSRRDRASQVSISRVDKEVQSKVDMVNAATYYVSRSLIPNPLPKASKGIQAFEEDPFRNILTDEEMINLMNETGDGSWFRLESSGVRVSHLLS